MIIVDKGWIAIIVYLTTKFILHYINRSCLFQQTWEGFREFCYKIRKGVNEGIEYFSIIIGPIYCLMLLPYSDNVGAFEWKEIITFVIVLMTMIDIETILLHTFLFKNKIIQS